MRQSFSSLPKVELHAHLNGSVSQETLNRLLLKKTAQNSASFQSFITSIRNGDCVNLDECFRMFKVIQQVIDDELSIYEAVCDVIQEFASDGVVYLELRSTPRCNMDTGLTQRSYITAIIKAIQDRTSTLDDLKAYNPEHRPIIVRYIPSIDRRNTVTFSEETVQLAMEFRKTTGLVVGIDLSGDGKINDAREFYQLLKKAKDSGLKIALHLAEVLGKTEETTKMLDLPPDRIGHGTFIHPMFGGTDALLEKTRNASIPLELCLTSNVKGQVTPSFDSHHFKVWYDVGHPLCICTDDKGVFATNLSDEYSCVADTFGLAFQDMVKIARKSIGYIFESDDVKEALHRHFTEWETLS